MVQKRLRSINGGWEKVIWASDTNLSIFSVPEDDAVLHSLWLGKGIHNSVGTKSPLKIKWHSKISRFYYNYDNIIDCLEFKASIHALISLWKNGPCATSVNLALSNTCSCYNIFNNWCFLFWQHILIFPYYFPLDDSVAIHLNKFQFPSSKDVWCHVWWDWTSGSWRIGKIIFIKLIKDKWTVRKTNGWSEMLSWAFSSGEILKSYWANNHMKVWKIWNNIGVYFKRINIKLCSYLVIRPDVRKVDKAVYG